MVRKLAIYNIQVGWKQIAELQASKSDGADLDWGESMGVGKVIKGEIQDIKEYGVIVNLENHKDVVGFVTHHQCKLLSLF